MGNRNAPYRHKDGSNCWTKNCKLGNTTQNKEQFIADGLKNLVSTPQEATSAPVTSVNTVQGQPAMIDSIAPLEAFKEAVHAGRIRGQQHPEYPYTIFKYSEQTQYTKDWDEITMASRGLVVNHETGEIIVRSFPKFFNYSENLTPEHLLTGKFVVADKLDGSLGLLYQNPDGEFEVTTSGGFQSEQAAHATKIYREKYDGKWEPNPDLSYHYEILYPQNRIVISYGDKDDLVLLGAVNKHTGRSVPLNEITEWKGERAEQYEGFDGIEAVINAPDPGIEKEGFVVHFTETDTRVKYKFNEYLKVHRIATGLNSTRIWEVLKTESGDTLESFKQSMPEEFIDYIDTTRGELQSKFNSRKKEILGGYEKLRAGLPSNVDQKTFALHVQQNTPRNIMHYYFSLFGGRPLREDKIWDEVKPDYERGFWATGTGKTNIEEK